MSEAPRVRRILGVDPGAVNAGLCWMDLHSDGTTRVTRLERVAFRESGAGGNDVGRRNLIASVRGWILANRERLGDTVVFIEEQRPGDISRTAELGEDIRGSARAAFDAANRKLSYSMEIIAVQDVFVTLLAQQCVVVLSSAIKDHFDWVFPMRKDLAGKTPHQRHTMQRYANKKNAVAKGRREVPLAVRMEFELRNPLKKDDAYDAYWIAQYGAERFFDPDGTLRQYPTPQKRKKDHQRRRVKKTDVYGAGAGAALPPPPAAEEPSDPRELEDAIAAALEAEGAAAPRRKKRARKSAGAAKPAKKKGRKAS